MRSRDKILANLEAIYRETYDRAKAGGEEHRMADLDNAYMRDQLMLEILLDIRDLFAVAPAAPAQGTSAIEKVEALRRLAGSAPESPAPPCDPWLSWPPPCSPAAPPLPRPIWSCSDGSGPATRPAPGPPPWPRGGTPSSPWATAPRWRRWSAGRRCASRRDRDWSLRASWTATSTCSPAAFSLPASTSATPRPPTSSPGGSRRSPPRSSPASGSPAETGTTRSG